VNGPAALAGGHAASGTALNKGSEFFPRCSQRGVHVRAVGVSEIMSLSWPTECPVEHLFDGTQGDPIVLGSDQEIEAGECSIEKLGLGRGQVFEIRDVEPVPQLFASADLFSTGTATSCAILWSE
jgi:hypothetical protein